ncbi:hypothetical protein [Victivallis vadensis]|uniref:hypothetical protein n=1 Tax=Victivallis vadensis TaxID=172901 RepID=UPI003AF918F5
MKKILLAAALIISAAAFAVDIDWQTVTGFNRELADNRTKLDQAVPAKVTEYADSVDAYTDQEKIAVIALRRAARTQVAGNDRSWQANKAFVDEQIAAAKLDKELTVPQYLSLLYLWYMESWCPDMYQYMKTQPGFEKWNDAGHCCYQLKKYDEAYTYYMAAQAFPERSVSIATVYLKDPAKAFEAAKLINTKICSLNTVQSVLNAVSNHLAGNDAISAADMKAFLQNANRKYSSMLLKDKANWEPVIAQIRTMLETF